MCCLVASLWVLYRSRETFVHTRIHRRAHTNTATYAHTQTHRHTRTHTDTQTDKHTLTPFSHLGYNTLCSLNHPLILLYTYFKGAARLIETYEKAGRSESQGAEALYNTNTNTSAPQIQCEWKGRARSGGEKKGNGTMGQSTTADTLVHISTRGHFSWAANHKTSAVTTDIPLHWWIYIHGFQSDMIYALPFWTTLWVITGIARCGISHIDSEVAGATIR